MSVHPCFEVSGGALDSFLPAFTTLDRPYDAYPLVCSNAHVETIFANKLRSSPYVRYRRECLRTSDDGVVALDWVAGDDKCLSPKSPILILLAGLTGGSGESYIKHMLLRARNKGWRVVAFNSRGCGDSPVITPKFYSASFTGDIGEAVVHISSRYPDANLYAAGWSLGANILVRYLGQEGKSCLLSGAVSLGNPFSLVIANSDFHKGFKRVYNKTLSASLHAPLFEEIEGDYNIPAACNSKSIREFDESLTRVTFGFKSADDYYLKSSSADSIKHVCTPLLCIQAANDPISPTRAIPREDIEENPNCMLIVTPKGGHLGWIAGDEAPFGAPWTDPIRLLLRYPECFLCRVGLSPYYPICRQFLSRLLRFMTDTSYGIVEILSRLLTSEGTSRAVERAGYWESVAEEDAYLELADPGEGTATARQSDEENVGGRYHPSLAYESESLWDLSISAKRGHQIRTTVVELEESVRCLIDSFYELATLDPSEAKRWYVPRWNITNDSLLDDGFSCRTLGISLLGPASGPVGALFFGMQEGLVAPVIRVKAVFFKALEECTLPLGGSDELLKAASLPIVFALSSFLILNLYAGVIKTALGGGDLPIFALMNVHARARGGQEACRGLFANWDGGLSQPVFPDFGGVEVSISAAPPSLVEDILKKRDTDEALGKCCCRPHLGGLLPFSFISIAMTHVGLRIIY
ncbi:embryogenesis-associated protein EMB8-like protein [Tanacetum coccineum]